MKGVILAGGKGTRLRPTTRVVNKHVIPIYDRPMIYYPVETLLGAGIDDILVISNADHIGKYIELLEEDFDADFNYKVQSEPKGIAHGVGLAENFVNDEFVVLLGDNILIGDLTREMLSLDSPGAKIFVKQVDEPAAYGVATIDDGKVTRLDEKPDDPPSDYAVLGLYRYTSDVFDIIDDLEPSDRGEYEITDVNKAYVERGQLEYEVFDGEWFDAGTPEGIYKASKVVRDNRQF
ncbi:sugar nucleotidyltransferase [Natronomonas halophila]|uniref:sugar nucleotidyltransferase n=1 Tax=Natronomonas halophila TaxID=2747817 RepID=UPI0015B73757|nr:sugar nucleotidyltransferase [Natronomonas halophila]QLD86838.1 sugar nucleotidyltransferase [Natronomonas halophila]